MWTVKGIPSFCVSTWADCVGYKGWVSVDGIDENGGKYANKT